MTFSPRAGVVGAVPGGGAVVGDRVRSVERIVEAAPARIGRVQRIARVGHGHHELGPRDMRDLVVDMGGLDAEIGPLGRQIADVFEEAPIGARIHLPPAPRPVPGVDLRLQRPAAGEQVAVERREIVQQGIEIPPEIPARDVESGQDLVLDEGVKLGGDPASSGRYPVCHLQSPDHTGLEPVRFKWRRVGVAPLDARGRPCPLPGPDAPLGRFLGHG